MTDKTLPERMREAAKVQREVAARRGVNDSEYATAYTSFSLRALADQFEGEDAEKAAAEAAHEAALDAEVEELARALADAFFGEDGPTVFTGNLTVREVYLKRARDLIAAGWRKQATP